MTAMWPDVQLLRDRKQLLSLKLLLTHAWPLLNPAERPPHPCRQDRKVLPRTHGKACRLGVQCHRQQVHLLGSEMPSRKQSQDSDTCAAR